jgi:hypothetical protein
MTLVILLALLQNADQRTLKSNLDKKLQSPFLSKAAWFTDYDKAREESAKSRKPLFAWFTRSDIESPACTAVEKELWSGDAFLAWAPAVVLYCHVTSRVDGDRLAALPQDKGSTGLPYLALLDDEGTLVVRFTGRWELPPVADAAKKAQAFVDLKHKAATDPEAKVDFALARLELDVERVALDEAKKRVDSLGELDAARKARATALLADIEALAIARTVGRDPQTRIDAGRRMAVMKKAGRVPAGDAAQAFWIHIMDFAEESREADLFAEALDALKARLPDSPEVKRYLDGLTKRLDAIRK